MPDERKLNTNRINLKNGEGIVFDLGKDAAAGSITIKRVDDRTFVEYKAPGQNIGVLEEVSAKNPVTIGRRPENRIAAGKVDTLSREGNQVAFDKSGNLILTTTEINTPSDPNPTAFKLSESERKEVTSRPKDLTPDERRLAQRSLEEQDHTAKRKQIGEIRKLLEELTPEAMGQMGGVRGNEMATQINPIAVIQNTERAQAGYRNWVRTFKLLNEDNLQPKEVAALDKAIGVLKTLETDRAAQRAIGKSGFTPEKIKPIVDGQVARLQQTGESHIPSGYPGHHTVTRITKDAQGYTVTTYNAGLGSDNAGGGMIVAIKEQRYTGSNIEGFIRSVNEVKMGISDRSVLDNALGETIRSVPKPGQGKGNCTTRSTREMLTDVLPEKLFKEVHGFLTGQSLEEEVRTPEELVVKLDQKCAKINKSLPAEKRALPSDHEQHIARQNLEKLGITGRSNTDLVSNAELQIGKILSTDGDRQKIQNIIDSVKDVTADSARNVKGTEIHLRDPERLKEKYNRAVKDAKQVLGLDPNAPLSQKTITDAGIEQALGHFKKSRVNAGMNEGAIFFGIPGDIERAVGLLGGNPAEVKLQRIMEISTARDAQAIIKSGKEAIIKSGEVKKGEILIPMNKEEAETKESRTKALHDKRDELAKLGIHVEGKEDLVKYRDENGQNFLKISAKTVDELKNLANREAAAQQKGVEHAFEHRDHKVQLKQSGGAKIAIQQPNAQFGGMGPYHQELLRKDLVKSGLANSTEAKLKVGPNGITDEKLKARYNEWNEAQHAAQKPAAKGDKTPTVAGHALSEGKINIATPHNEAEVMLGLAEGYSLVNQSSSVAGLNKKLAGIITNEQNKIKQWREGEYHSEVVDRLEYYTALQDKLNKAGDIKPLLRYFEKEMRISAQLPIFSEDFNRLSEQERGLIKSVTQPLKISVEPQNTRFDPATHKADIPSSAKAISSRNFGLDMEVVFMDPPPLEVFKKLGISCNPTSHSSINRPFSAWTIKRDGPNMEVVTPILKGQNGINEVYAVTSALQAKGAKVDVSTGLHVHNDASGIDFDATKRLLINYIHEEGTIDAQMPPHRRGRGNTHIRSLLYSFGPMETEVNYASTKEKAIKAISAARSPEELQNLFPAGTKLRTYTKHGTVEYRHHEGTVNPKEVVQWIHYCDEFTDSAINNKPPPKFVREAQRNSSVVPAAGEVHGQSPSVIVRQQQMPDERVAGSAPDPQRRTASLSEPTLNAIRDSKAIGSYQSPSGAVIVQYVFNNKSDAEALLHHLNKDNPHDQSTNILHRPRGTPESEPYIVQVKSEKAKAFGLLPENLTYDELVAGVKPSQSINLTEKGVERASPPVAKNSQQNVRATPADPVAHPANSGRPQSRAAKRLPIDEHATGRTFNLAQMVYGDYNAIKNIAEHGPDTFSMGMLGANKGLLGASLAHAHCTKEAVAKLLELSATTGNEEAKRLAQKAVSMLQESRPKAAAEWLEKLATATRVRKWNS